ncbi:hypothetical protein [Pseudoalteromonas sp. T1lg23B]|uniref:hypothetical protein n=1 Tax=Pseudoalteromonas sp. T1lg23B TaxID=2077097 RepID=UPI000CF5EC1F|nr:hypothetical protein [Pseudoalteromonas sp. T1lg23B]
MNNQLLSVITLTGMLGVNITTHAAPCSDSALQALMQRPPLDEAFTQYKTIVQSQYVVWTAQVEDLSMGMGGSSASDLVMQGNVYEKEIVESLKRLGRLVTQNEHLVCQAELQDYIMSGIKDFQSWHQQFKKEHLDN